MNTIINKSKLHIAASAFAIAAMVLSLVPMQAFADHDPFNGEPQTKVTLCHSGSGKNFVSNSPSITATGGSISLEGHQNHSSDIIPPFHFDAGVDGILSFPGQNWPAGKGVWDSGCKTPNSGTGSITVVKAFDGEQGPKDVSDFTLKVDGEEVVSGVKVNYVASKGSVKISDYVITESDIPTDYGLLSVSCVDSNSDVIATGATSASFALNNNEDITCTVTNKYTDPNLPQVTKGSIIIKKSTNNTAGEMTAFDFTGTLGAFDVNGNNTDSQVFGNLSAGDFTITESDETGWDFGSVSCTGADFVPSGTGVTVTLDEVNNVVENAVCTFTNTIETTPPTPCNDPKAQNYGELAACKLFVTQCITTPTNLLTDGSFENTVVTNASNWQIFPLVAPWTISLSNGLELWANGFMGGASDGNQNAELDGNDATMITQTVATIPGATYELRFDFKARTANSADNHIEAAADGTSLVNVSSANTNWVTYGKTFVADASTDVSFVDLGTAQASGGTGTLLDNAVLCLVREPAPVDYCPNIDGTQTDTDGYLKDVNGQCYMPINECSVNVISDSSNTYNDAGAIEITANPAWVQTITDSLAKWIWGVTSDTPIQANVDEVQTFVKTFVWSGTASAAELKISSDNGYSVSLNGTVVGADAGEFNYQSVDTIIDLTDDIIQGVNTLEISVTNKGNNSTSLASNPGGLLYDLTITDTTGDCGDGGGGDPDPEVLSCSITASDTSIRRGSDVTLNWSSVGASFANLLDSSVGTTSSLLVEDIGADTTYTLTVYDQQENSATCSVTIDTRSGGGGGGGGTRLDRTPDGDVLGDSDSATPEPLVLGEQTSAVPTGAPNTGKGGSVMTILGQFLALPRRRNIA